MERAENNLMLIALMHYLGRRLIHWLPQKNIKRASPNLGAHLTRYLINKLSISNPSACLTDYYGNQ